MLSHNVVFSVLFVMVMLVAVICSMGSLLGLQTPQQHEHRKIHLLEPHTLLSHDVVVCILFAASVVPVVDPVVGLQVQPQHVQQRKTS